MDIKKLGKILLVAMGKTIDEIITKLMVGFWLVTGGILAIKIWQWVLQ